MKSVLIATSHSSDAEDIRKVIEKEFKTFIITTPGDADALLENLDLIILDYNFTDSSGIDFLMHVLSKIYLPVLILTPDDDAQCALEALRAGAYNYVVKSGNYLQILNIAINEAISKFNEREHLKEIINTLKEQVKKLKKQLAGLSPQADAKGQASSPAPEKEINLVDEIISRFKRGEINLPAIPRINTKFKQLISAGASITDVANLLKQDLAISSKLINISNSVYYRGMVKNSSLEDAINRLGLGTTRQYVEVITNRSLYTTNNPKYVKIMEKLWIHSLSCAYAAEIMAEILKLKIDTDTFTVGLTHDIGKLVLLQIIGELEIKGKFGRELDIRDLNQTLDVLHSRFGAVLLKRWDFPEGYVRAALHHDHFDDVRNPDEGFLVLHLSNLLVKSMGYSLTPEKEIDLQKSKSGYLLRIRSGEIEEIQTKVKELIDQTRGTF